MDGPAFYINKFELIINTEMKPTIIETESLSIYIQIKIMT